jgi:hypothetical protein
MMNLIIKNTPLLSTGYGFIKTAREVYNSTNTVGAVTAAVKGIVLDCSPPVVKYPLKCSILALQIGLCVSTGGNPVACSFIFSMMEFMIDD